MKVIIKQDPARGGARPLNTIGAILIGVFLILTEINKLVKQGKNFTNKQRFNWAYFWFIPVGAILLLLLGWRFTH